MSKYKSNSFHHVSQKHSTQVKIQSNHTYVHNVYMQLLEKHNDFLATKYATNTTN